MIILYEYTETAFTNNGLGCLNDATSCSVKETLNGEYELEMEYPVNGIHYSDIQLRRIILAKPNSYDQTQPFRIYSISKPIGGLVTVNAEHISYDMSGLPVRGALEHYAWYVNDVFDHIRNNSVYPCPFTFSSDITEEKKSISLSKPRSVKAFLGTDEGLLSLFGGEWEFDRYKAILHKERGQNRGVSIEYGKNLTDVTQDEACSEMYTAVYPYYYQEDDGLQRLDDDVVKILDTPYKNVYVLDLSSEFDEMPTQDQLRAKTQEYIKKNKLDKPKVSLKVSFIQNPEVIEALQDVRLGDTVGVKFIKIGVDTTSRCISYEFNVLTEQYNSIELGEPTKTIVDTMTLTSSRIDDTQDNLDDEIDRATDAEGVLSTRIDKTDSDITLEVTRAKGAEESLGSRITLTEESITAEVTRAQGAENSLGSRITQTAESIETEVTRAQGAENSLASTITQTAESITAEVNKKVGTAEIRSKFAMSPENVTIESGSINFKSNTIGIDSDNFGLDPNTGETKFYGAQTFYDDKSMSNSGYFGYGYIDGMSSPLAFYFNADLYVNKVKVALMTDISNFITGIKVTESQQSGDSGYTKNYFLRVSGSGTYKEVGASQIHVSDRRLKRDITIAKDITNAYMRLTPVHFRYKENVGGVDGHWHYGFIAQDVKQAFIDAGIYSENEALVGRCVEDDTWLLDKDELHAMHVQMIQKQQHEIESLKMENLQIKGELDILKQKLKRLEEKLC